VVPNHHAVHVVLDDFGKLGRAYREADENFVALMTSWKISSRASTKIRSAFLRSTRPRVGLAM